VVVEQPWETRREYLPQEGGGREVVPGGRRKRLYETPSLEEGERRKKESRRVPNGDEGATRRLPSKWSKRDAFQVASSWRRNIYVAKEWFQVKVKKRNSDPQPQQLQHRLHDDVVAVVVVVGGEGWRNDVFCRQVSTVSRRYSTVGGFPLNRPNIN